MFKESGENLPKRDILEKTPTQGRETETETLEDKEGNSIEDEFERFRQTIEAKRGKGKMINLQEIIRGFNGIKKTIKTKEGTIRLSEMIGDWADSLRYEDPLLVEAVLNSADDVFNHRWPLRMAEKREKKLPEASSKALWEESFEASRALDKAIGRKMAKALRKGVKKGEKAEEAINRILMVAVEKGIDLPKIRTLLKDYEARYKVWRDYIEEEAEKEQLKQETYKMLKDMREKGEIDEKGLLNLSMMGPDVEKLGAAIFGDYKEKTAARKLLRQIRRKRRQAKKRQQMTKKTKKEENKKRVEK